MNKKFKRTLAGLTAFLMAFSAAAIPQVADSIGLSVVASAEEYDYSDLMTYETNEDGTAKIVRFNYKDDLTEIVIPETINDYGEEYTVTSIGAYAFSTGWNSTLKKVTIPKTVTTIEEYAFSGCSALETIELSEGLKTIGEYAFQSCTNIKSIDIPEGVETIGERAFSYNVFAENLSIPKSVKSIGDGAFLACRLKTITVAEDNENFSAEDAILYNKDKTEIVAYSCGKTDTSYTIPESVTSIRAYAFWRCNLENITIPSKVNFIGDSVFSSSPALTEISVVEENGSYYSENGVLFSKDKKKLIIYPMAKADTSYVIPSGVETIGAYAFLYCDKLTSVTIPESVTTIGEWAFDGCSNLTSVTLSEGLESIENHAFYYCDKLGSIEIPASVKTIGNQAFDDCKNLSSVTLNEGLTTIGSNAFASCSSLTEIEIPSTVTSIENNAFFASGITKAIFKKGVTEIGDSVFNCCSKLETVVIPNSVTKIGYAFPRCTSLREITIPGSVTEIAYTAFDGCTSLEKITLPESLKDTEWYGIPDNVQIIISSNAVTYNTNYVSVKTSDGTPVTSGIELDDGVELIITVTVPTGMKLNSVKANGETLTAEDDGTYKYTTSGGAAIVADVVAKEYPLAITSNENATIVVKDKDGNALETGAAIKYGDKFTVEVTPAVGYKTTAVSVENATLGDDKFYTVNADVADGASITVSATVEEKVFTITSLPENVTLLKNDKDEVTASANNTFKKGDKIAIYPHFGYDMVMVPMIKGISDDVIYTTGDGQGNAYYIFTGEEKDGEFTIFSGVEKCFKIDTTKVPEHVTLFVRFMSGGEKSARAAELTPVDYPVTAGTSFYDGYMLVIKIDDDCTVFGDVKVGDTIVEADENGEYVYTFTGDEVNEKPIVVSADVKKNTCTVTFSGMTVSKEDGTELKSGDKVAEGTKLIISGWPSAGALCKSGGFTVNGVAAEKLENGDYTYTVKAEDTKIEIKEIVYFVKGLEVTGLKDTYYVGDELEIVVDSETNKVSIKGVTVKFIFEDDTTTEDYPLYENWVKNFDTSKPNDAMKFTIDCGEDKKDITVKVVAAVPTKIDVTSNFKKLYYTDDPLDVSGGKITVTYDNGKTTVKDITADMVSGFDAEAVNGQKSLTITYTENGTTLTTPYTVDICDEALTVTSISASGYKTEYYVGDEFDTSAGIITVYYNEQTNLFEEIGLKAAEITGFDSSTAAESQTITVKYGGKETTFTVKINAVSVTSAALTKPTKTDYKTGDRLNLDGGKLTVVYSSGKIENIPLTDSRISVTGFSSSTKGSQEITVKFGEIEKKFSVYVTASSSSGGSGGSSGGGSYGGGSSSGGSSSTTKNPTVDGKETTWTDVASDIAKLTEGKTETIELSGGKTVPVEVVKAIASSNAEVTLKVDEVFSWTVDGADIDPKDAKAADFSITKTTVAADNTPRGTRGTSFSIKGTNVKSELNINFKATHSGEFANLYKKVDGKLVFVDNVKVDKNGAASGLEVSEKGEYVVMLGKYSDRAGDMDNDGIINPKDSYAILRNFLDIEEGENPLVADINGDGFINAKDAYQVLVEYLNIG